MKNLDLAIKSIDTEKVTKANELLKKITETRDDNNYLIVHIWDLVYEVAKAIGGYSKGSDVYDKGDETFVISLLGWSAGSDDENSFTMDDYEFPRLNEAYSSLVMSQVEEFDFKNMGQFQTIFIQATTAGIILTEQDLADMFKYSSVLKDELFEMMNKPRG